MTPDIITEFRQRLYKDWLPSFCDAPHRDLSTSGFREESISKLTEHDAYWFIKAIDLQIVTEADGFFVAPLSKAKEQIFWTGSKNVNPRPLTLWIEPIITIGALAKLHISHGWPIDRLGAQSKTWAFDLVGYGDFPDDELLACEVKKSTKEVDVLIDLMISYGADSSIKEPSKGKGLNAYRKVAGIKRTWPTIFWALGPDDYGKVFKIVKNNENEFDLVETGLDQLNVDSLVALYRKQL